MDRVLLDTNIVIDYLSATRERHDNAVLLLEGLFDSARMEPCVLASSIKDAYYVMCRHYGTERLVRMRLEGFCEVVDVADLDASCVRAAFSSPEPDLEDAIVGEAAAELGALAIVTRDARAYASSSVPAMDAVEFRRRFADAL